MHNQKAGFLMTQLFFFRDGDSILDFLDNCPSHANGDQSDVDKDGTGKSIIR